MPLYDAKCIECGEVFEHLCKISEMSFIRCPKCYGRAETLISHTGKNRDWFKPHWRENLDFSKEYISTRGEFKQHCIKNGVISHALGDVRNITEV